MRGRRRLLFWGGLVLALALVAGGGVLGYRGYAAQTGPGGVVRSYFAALADGDAAQALAYGDVPPGPRALLSATALAEQQRLAPLTQFAIRTTTVHGARAQVRVHYELGFPAGAQPVDTTVALYRRGGEWRLTRAAVATQLLLPEAADRAAVLGTRISDGTVLLFPGAAPVRLDTPYLQLAPAQAGVDFESGATTEIDVTPSAAGRRQADRLVLAALQACITGHGPQTCPLPDGRYVPGSLRASLSAPPPALTVTVANSAAGILDVAGSATITGTFAQLTFQNRVRSGTGRVTVPVHAHAYAVPPLTFRWAHA